MLHARHCDRLIAVAVGKRSYSSMLGQKRQAPEPEPPGGRKRGTRAGAKLEQEVPGPPNDVPRQLTRQRSAAVALLPPPCFSPVTTLGRRMHIATSGFSYDHWHAPGSFYEGVPKSGELEFYCRQFDCSELNATFYHFFKDEAFVGWRKKAEATGRPSFQWVVKAQQLYTHKKRLNIDDAFVEGWGRFWQACQLLRPHLGPVLCQFPSTFATTTSKGGDNIERLRALGKVLPAEGRFAFEFRHSSWFCPEVYAILKEHDWCLVMCHVAPGRVPHGEKAWTGTLAKGANPPQDEYPLDACSWGVYLRFHGSAGQYVGRHGAKEMRRWADWCKTRAAEGKECYLAFNNTDGTPPPAIADARELAAAFRANGVFEQWED